MMTDAPELPLQSRARYIADLRAEIDFRRSIYQDTINGISIDFLEDLLIRAGDAATSGYATLLYELHSAPRPRNQAELQWAEAWRQHDDRTRRTVAVSPPAPPPDTALE